MSTSETTTAHEHGTSSFTADWRRWHEDHERRRADPGGFLAVTGLYWITEQTRRLPEVPGSWRLGDSGPVVELDEDENLRFDGTELRGIHEWAEIAERDGIIAEYDGGLLEIARRGGRFILRPRRGDHAFLGRYSGTPAYEPDLEWRKEALYRPFDAPRPTEVGAAVDGLAHVYDAPGVLEFTVGDEFHRLTAFPGRAPGELFVLFTDDTSGVTTYAANRSLQVATPDGEGRTVLDFNRAVNLPCAYTDFATCPLPPRENHLPFAVTAGEKSPEERVEGRLVDVGLVPVS